VHIIGVEVVPDQAVTFVDKLRDLEASAAAAGAAAAAETEAAPQKTAGVASQPVGLAPWWKAAGAAGHSEAGGCAPYGRRVAKPQPHDGGAGADRDGWAPQRRGRRRDLKEVSGADQRSRIVCNTEPKF